MRPTVRVSLVVKEQPKGVWLANQPLSQLGVGNSGTEQKKWAGNERLVKGENVPKFSGNICEVPGSQATLLLAAFIV